MSYRNIRLLVAYDGTDFQGWQIQKNKRTVQGEMETALKKIHKEHVTLTGSGRTDAGVHAAGQTANFYTGIQSMEPGRFVPALNSLLPHDIRVLDARETCQDFHSRFDARMRTYRYYLIVNREALPWEKRYAYNLRRQPDMVRLNEYARLLKGEMDCSAFAIPGDKSKSRSRFIYNACFFPDGNRLVFEISANAFLWKMVRSVIGTLIHFDEKGFASGYLKEVIKSGDSTLTGPKFPPEGLFLWKVDYYRE